MGRVVVGVDGSPVAREALAFAVDEARMRGATLEVVHVHEFPQGRLGLTGSAAAEVASASSYAYLAEHDRQEQDQEQERTRQAAERVVSAMLEKVDVGDVKVERTVLYDRRPARRLVELVNGNADIDLLVVGSRGHGELTGMLLGSVSQACVNHARVPVTVVHPRRR